MGGTGKQGDVKRPPRGITIREHASVRSIQIEFAYRGVRCRESLRLEPTAANIKYADGLRVEIARKIADGVFVYTDYFPDSPKAVQFGHAPVKKTVGELLRDQLKGYEKATANGQMSPSTLNGYRKVIEGKLLPKFDRLLLKDLTPAMLREWIGGLGITAKSSRNIITPLRSTLDDALNDELIPYNPLDKIALKKLLTRTSIKSTYEVDPFDEAEKDAILAATNGQKRNLFQFAFWSGLRTSELIALEWGDTGFGIPEYEHEQIFDAFYQGKSNAARKGHGLGLMIVKRLAERISADLTLSSRVDHGTVFRLKVPLASLPETSQSAPKIVHSEFNFDGRVVAVLDDDESVRNSLDRSYR